MKYRHAYNGAVGREDGERRKDSVEGRLDQQDGERRKDSVEGRYELIRNAYTDRAKTWYGHGLLTRSRLVTVTNHCLNSGTMARCASIIDGSIAYT